MTSAKPFYTLILLLGLLVLQGCGFHLKQGAQLSNSVSPMAIEGLTKYNQLRIALTQLLADSDIQVTDIGEPATTRLRIKRYESNRRVLSVDGNGKTLEYELHEGVTFDLVTSDGRVLVEEQSVSTLQTYLNSETEVLGKQQEEAILRQDMRRDLADRMIRRLDSQL